MSRLIKISMILCFISAPITSSWSIEEKNYKETFRKKVLPWAREFKVKMFKGKKGKKLA